AHSTATSTSPSGSAVSSTRSTALATVPAADCRVTSAEKLMHTHPRELEIAVERHVGYAGPLELLRHLVEQGRVENALPQHRQDTEAAIARHVEQLSEVAVEHIDIAGA